jgi:hypothetical protein
MKSSLARSALLTAALAFAASAWPQDPGLLSKLRKLPGVASVRMSDGKESERGSYEIEFDQPVDWKSPKGQRFRQRVVLHHASLDAPVILLTEGYWAMQGEANELRRLLGQPNVVTVEHRYFGRSVPKPLRWEALTVRNAADDMHRIVSSLRQIYKGKWVSTGYSKSGQTALFYKCFYPNDVDATVAYVAPINVAQEDPRISKYMETVGDADTRAHLKAFQIALLKREDEIIPLLKLQASDYSMGIPQAYEYGVLEAPYGYWQYGKKPSDIPAPDASAEDLIKAYQSYGGLDQYSDVGRKTWQPFQYQAFTEIGYYNYDITDLKPYLRAVPNPTNVVLTPPEARDKIVYNPATMAFVFPFLQYKANHVVYVYGETDAWSATQMPLLGRTDAVKIVVKGKSHNASILAGSPEQKEEVFGALERWLGLKIARS